MERENTSEENLLAVRRKSDVVIIDWIVRVSKVICMTNSEWRK